jgi:hypothetical protein
MVCRDFNAAFSIHNVKLPRRRGRASWPGQFRILNNIFGMC